MLALRSQPVDTSLRDRYGSRCGSYRPPVLAYLMKIVHRDKAPMVVEPMLALAIGTHDVGGHPTAWSLKELGTSTVRTSKWASFPFGLSLWAVW